MAAAPRRRAPGPPARPGGGRAAAPRARTAFLRPSELLAAADQGRFPGTLWLEGPSEPLKAALLGELKAAWRRHVGPAAPVRVFLAGESGVDELLAAYHGTSLFDPRELLVLLEVEDWSRGEARIGALAEGLAREGGGSTLVLVESAAETPRKGLDAARAACAARIDLPHPTPPVMRAWATHRLKREGLAADPGAIEALVDAGEGDGLAFVNELDKVCAYCAAAGRVRVEDVAALLQPAVGADLPEYLAAVALGQPGLALQRLARVLAGGENIGLVLWALGNLVGGAMGGWSRDRNASLALSRRARPPGLARALDAVYRAEAAWKGGRADPVAALEQATREVCAAR